MDFDTILIANRGEIAVRIIRACRELGIIAATICSQVDRSALHARLADEVFLLEAPEGKRHPYLDAERIVEAALRCGAQAIHPGYGFLSEQAHFARACREAGLVFIGPPPEAIELMGSKIAARRLAEEAGVPTLPGSRGGSQSVEQLRAEAARVGFPLLIKASAGGGGKGMRAVQHPDEFDAALEGAQREARAAFGDDAVFLERLLERPRHVEIQVLADSHGACVHLFERECSIQRRHQKIVEESPSPALTPALRAAMGQAAVRLARAAGYENAGTVEFLLDEEGHFFFLEMNTRLQVEHPVTELVTGLDLVRLQIAIAAGERLPFQQDELSQRGHAIEARVYAEDPATFLPATGQLALFAPPEGPGIRNDAGVEHGDEVTVHYDPLLAKLIVFAPDRRAAVERLRWALDDYAALGVTTNLPLLRAIAWHPAFAAGATHTGFLGEHGLAGAPPEPDHAPIEVLAVAAILDMALTPPPPFDPSTALRAGPAVPEPDEGQGRPLPLRQARGSGEIAAFTDPWEAGSWRLMREGMPLHYTLDDQTLDLVVHQSGDEWHIHAGTMAIRAAVVARRADSLTLRLAREGAHERLERFRFAREGRAWLIAWRGASYRIERAGGLDLDTTGGRHGLKAGHAGLEAPMPGTVVKVLAHEGQAVSAHQPLVVLEAMKMEHVVAAPYDGVVRRLPYEPGALVARGAIVVELDGAE